MGRFHITRVAGPPTAAPKKSGDHWVDTSSNIHYLSVGTSDVNDWINAAGVVNHTGEITGTTALSLDKSSISNKTVVPAAVGDHVLVGDVSDSNNLKKVTVQTIIDLAGGGGGDIVISSAIPKIEAKDTGGAVPTRVVGRISGDLTDPGDGSEDFDWIFEGMVGGSMFEWMRFNSSDAEGEKIIDLNANMRINSGSSTDLAVSFTDLPDVGYYKGTNAFIIMVNGKEALHCSTGGIRSLEYIRADKSGQSETILGVNSNGDGDSGIGFPGDNKMWLTTGGKGRIYLSATGNTQFAPTAALADGSVGTSMIHFSLDETGHNLNIKVKYSDGTTVKTASIALT